MPSNNFTCYVASQKSLDIVWSVLSVYKFVLSLKFSVPGFFHHCLSCDISLTYSILSRLRSCNYFYLYSFFHYSYIILSSSALLFLASCAFLDLRKEHVSSLSEWTSWAVLFENTCSNWPGRKHRCPRALSKGE
jgi:hypothetical protein